MPIINRLYYIYHGATVRYAHEFNSLPEPP